MGAPDEDDELSEEARLFRMQEAIHSQAHKLHVAALIERYPGLRETLDASVANYDALYEAHDAGIAFAVCITEGVPVHDTLKVVGTTPGMRIRSSSWR